MSNPSPIVHSPGSGHGHLPRGARRAKPHTLFQAAWHEPVGTPAAEVVVIPPQMSMQGNNQYGDCVTAEEAAAKEAYSVYCGLPELVVPDSVSINWASSHGYLNGAELQPVMNDMARDGMTINGTNYKDGPWQVVEYTDETKLQSALAVGPVKIAIDSSALSPGAGSGNGWYNFGGQPGQFQNTDHCISIFGYCTAERFYAAIGQPVPSAAAGKTGYILYTWAGVGFCDHAWLLSTCVEAYVRTPTTVGQTPVPPVPPSPPSPPSPPAPTPVTIPVTGQGTYPGGTFRVAGLGNHQVTIPPSVIPITGTATLPTSDLTTAQIDGYLSQAGETAAKYGLTPQQWQQILAVLLQLLPIFFPPTPSSPMHANLGKLTPQQWQAIIALILQILPIIIGG